jgi:putative membrane protein
MRKKGREELAMLDAKSGSEYQKAYVDAMVKGHAEVLELLETRLIPAATDEQVRNFLTSSRDHVAMHLDRGKALQSDQ